MRSQPAMRKLLLGTCPCIGGAVYYFGWRSLAMILFCCAVGFFCEWLFCRRRKEPVTEAVFVTAVLFALAMPPGAGWHVLAAGMVFAIVVAKEVFGGFGRNIFNPALAGRCFVYVCFPVAMTGIWYPPAQGSLGALLQWTSARQADGTIAVTGATPMAHLKAGRLVRTPDAPYEAGIPFRIGSQETAAVRSLVLYKAQFFGRISGSMGVTSALLILIGAVFLFWTRTASRTTILSVVLTYAVLNELLFRLGIAPVPGAVPAVLGGGFLLGACFMATDPVSSPRTEWGRFYYGVLIAAATVVIRNFSIFNGGLMFAVLLGNMFAPIIDYGVQTFGQRKKAKRILEENAG